MSEDPSRNAPDPPPFRFVDPRQARIYRRLQLVGSGPASFYLDACRLMAADPPVLSTTHLVAHCLREIESALRDVLEPVVEEQDSPEEGGGKRKSGGSTHESEIRAILRGLGIPETEPVAEAWLKLPGRDSTYNLAGRAHRNSLDRPRPLDSEFQGLWTDIQNVLDAVLDKFEARYTDAHNLLDELLAKGTPSNEDLRALKEHVPNNSVSYRYFFDRLESVGWLRPLTDGGFFSSPPEPEQDYEAGGFRFVSWPQSTYLEKMVDEDPATVKEIIQELPATQNVRVYEELADVARKLPIDMVAELVPKLKEWVGHPVQWALPDKVSDLIVQLARGGRADEALDLARELFALSPHNIYGDTDGGMLPAAFEARARFDDFLYEEYLGKCSTVLAEMAGERALALFCDLLEDALHISVGSHEDKAGGGHPYEDPLHVSRPAIEDHSQNQLGGLESSLISAVRNIADHIAEEDPESIPRLVRAFEERNWRIFSRLALYMLWRFPDAASEMVAERLTDRRRFEDPGLRHEYTLLARSSFNGLGAEEQETILGWIEEGPDLAAWKDRREEMTGQRPTDEDAARSVQRWKRDRIALLGDGLPLEWQEKYEDLVSQLGQPEHPEFASYTSEVWEGPESPRTVEELEAMTVDDIVVYLGSWRPTDNFMAPSPDGLARVLTGVVAKEPERFAAASDRFRDLDPAYVRGLLNGLRDAVKQGCVFPWSPVLDLCQWVVEQPREISGREVQHRELIEHHDLDPDWGWTRKAIADLLESGFEAGESAVPSELRKEAWGVLLPLTHDPEPDAEYEVRYGGSNMDPATLSLNTVRSQALHAVLRYALWVRRHLQGTPDAEERLARGFDEMPEVREVLDVHLGPDKDSSLAVRAVYGWWFPQLTVLDEPWSVSNVTRIFPLEESLSDLFRAAWGTYVLSQRPYDRVFEILVGVYAEAIEQLAAGLDERWMTADPKERLAWHLLALYWRGKLDLENPEGLLARFYGAASDNLRAHAVDFLTKQLHNPEVEVSEEVLARLRTLWEVRLNSLKELAPDQRAKELGAFVDMFASGKFNRRWSMEQLNEALSLGAQVDRDRDVMEFLTSHASDMPLLAVRCVGKIIETTEEHWRMLVRRESIREILTLATRSTDEEAQREAKEQANRLVARGYSDFNDLTQ